MGAQLVGQAYVFALDHSLTANEMRLLAWMALHALDGDATPKYFMGREQTAIGLGRRIPDAPRPDDPNGAEVERQRTAAFEAIKTATRGLVKAGAIRNVMRGREGRRAEFQLTLTPVDNLLPLEMRGRKNLPLKGRKNLPLAGRKFLPGGEGKTFPQGTTEEPLEEQHGGPTSTRRTTSLAEVHEERQRA